MYACDIVIVGIPREYQLTQFVILNLKPMPLHNSPHLGQGANESPLPASFTFYIINATSSQNHAQKVSNIKRRSNLILT